MLLSFPTVQSFVTFSDPVGFKNASTIEARIRHVDGISGETKWSPHCFVVVFTSFFLKSTRVGVYHSFVLKFF